MKSPLRLLSLLAGVFLACSGTPEKSNEAPDAGTGSADGGTSADAGTVLTSVEVSCDPMELTAGSNAQCVATPKDAAGRPLTDAMFEWSSDDPEIATVDDVGRVTALAAGSVQIAAVASSAGGTQRGETTLTVRARPPTIHDANITADETWRAADNPHHVTRPIDVGGDGSPTLTIEAGAQILFLAYSGLTASAGSILALGTPDSAIVMGPAEDAPLDLWNGLRFETAGSESELNHVILSKCGQQGACLTVVEGDAPVLKSVTVQDSRSNGISLSGGRIGPGSGDLRIIGSGGRAALVDSDNAASIPAGTQFIDNAENEVRVIGNVAHSQIWPALAVPYAIAGYVVVGSEKSPVLTLLPGTEIRFAAGAALLVGYEHQGALVASGTAQAPIRFVPDGTSPTPGHWQGLHFWNANGSVLDHVIVSHAGDSNTGGNGNVNVYRELGAFVTNTTASDSSGCGVTRSDGTQPGTTPVTTDFTTAAYGNTFPGNAVDAQCAN